MLFFPNSFAKFGSPESVRQALNRLEKKGKLIRISHGIYLYPKKHKLLGTLMPTLEEVAYAISKRDKARIIPTGIQALNKLGLSTQVPLNVIYLTDGTSRSVKIGNRSIKFRRASPKILSVKSEVVLLVIQGLRELGEENVNSKIIEKIQSILENVDLNILKHDIGLAPRWIAKIINTK